MLTDQLKELQAAKEQLAKLEMRIAVERKAALAALPGQFGFADMKAFIRALGETEGDRRTRIPAEIRAEVKKLLTAGKTGTEIAAATGISLPASKPSRNPSDW